MSGSSCSNTLVSSSRQDVSAGLRSWLLNRKISLEWRGVNVTIRERITGGGMRSHNWAGLALTVLVLGSPFAIAQTQDDFFDDSYVHEIRLVLKPSDWDTLRRPYDDNFYYHTDVHW